MTMKRYVVLTLVFVVMDPILKRRKKATFHAMCERSSKQAHLHWAKAKAIAKVQLNLVHT